MEMILQFSEVHRLKTRLYVHHHEKRSAVDVPCVKCAQRDLETGSRKMSRNYGGTTMLISTGWGLHLSIYYVKALKAWEKASTLWFLQLQANVVSS